MLTNILSSKFKKTKIIFGSFILLVIFINFVVPPLALNRLNNYLANFSPGFSAHIESLDISFIRAAYKFSGLTVKAKKDNVIFIKAETIDVSLAWRELLQFKVRTDIEANQVQLFVDKQLYALAESGGREKSDKKFSGSKEDALKAKNKLFPVDVTHITLNRSAFYFADKMGIPVDDQLRLTDINATMTTLLPDSSQEPSRIWATALFMNSAKMKVFATTYLKAQPLEWDSDFEVRGFDLTRINDFMKRQGPLTFKSGYLDVFAEIKSEQGNVEGYIKPFLSQIDIIGNKKDFSGVGHFLVEVVASLSELIFISGKTETISTKIPVSGTTKNVKVDRSKSLAGALKHAFRKEYTPQIEDSISLNKEKK